MRNLNEINKYVNERVRDLKPNKNGKYRFDSMYKKIRIASVKDDKAELKKDLIAKILKIEKALGDGDDISRLRVLESMSFEDVFEGFLKTKTNYGKDKETTERKKFQKYFQSVSQLKTTEINDEVVNEWHKNIYHINDNVLSEKDKISDDYINRIIKMMMNVLNYGKNKRYFKVSLNTVLPVRKVIKATVSKTETDNRFITLDELNLLSDCLEDKEKLPTKVDFTPQWFRFLVRFLFFTGARISEARAIKVSDFGSFIDRKNGNKRIYYVAINKQLNDKNKLNLYTKTRNDRMVFLDADIYEEFTTFLNEYGMQPDEYVLDYSHCGYSIIRQRLSEQLKLIIKAYIESGELPDTMPINLSPHSFRYSAASYLHERNIGVNLAAQMLGHTRNVMLEIYDRINKNEVANDFGVEIDSDEIED